MTPNERVVVAAKAYVEARREQWQRYEQFGRITERNIKKEQDAFNALEQAVQEAGNPTQCSAVIYHGPGHQSKTPCDQKGAHEQHHAHPMGYDLYWRGNEGMTGVFDESPEEGQ